MRVSPDADVLKKTIIKLQKRVLTGAATLLVKIKDHRGDPLNEEADIRAEMGHRKEQKPPGGRMEQPNRQNNLPMEGRTTRQKAGEIESFRSLEIGETKW
jgi:hypothetical protein